MQRAVLEATDSGGYQQALLELGLFLGQTDEALWVSWSSGATLFRLHTYLLTAGLLEKFMDKCITDQSPEDWCKGVTATIQSLITICSYDMGYRS